MDAIQIAAIVTHRPLVVATADNLDELRNFSAHSFTEEPRAGDIVYAIPAYGGDHLVRIWTDQRRAGLGMNGKHPLYEGSLRIVAGKLLLDATEGDRPVTFDLNSGHRV